MAKRGGAPRIATPGSRAGHLGKFTIEGMSEVLQMFEDAKKAFNPEWVQDAILPAAWIIRDQARMNVRKGKGHIKDGQIVHLRDAIFAVKGKRSVANVIAGVNIKRAPYAHFVEFGTPPHPIRGKGDVGSIRRWLWFDGLWHKVVQHPGSERFPFLRPAVRSTRGRVAAAITRGLQDLLGRTVRPTYGPVFTQGGTSFGRSDE